MHDQITSHNTTRQISLSLFVYVSFQGDCLFWSLRRVIECRPGWLAGCMAAAVVRTCPRRSAAIQDQPRCDLGPILKRSWSWAWLKLVCSGVGYFMSCPPVKLWHGWAAYMYTYAILCVCGLVLVCYIVRVRFGACMLYCACAVWCLYAILYVCGLVLVCYFVRVRFGACMLFLYVCGLALVCYIVRVRFGACSCARLICLSCAETDAMWCGEPMGFHNSMVVFDWITRAPRAPTRTHALREQLYNEHHPSHGRTP